MHTIHITTTRLRRWTSSTQTAPPGAEKASAPPSLQVAAVHSCITIITLYADAVEVKSHILSANCSLFLHFKTASLIANIRLSPNSMTL